MIVCVPAATRLIGQQNATLWMAEHPERMDATIDCLGAYHLELVVSMTLYC
jgi:hypothetical protein